MDEKSTGQFTIKAQKEYIAARGNELWEQNYDSFDKSIRKRAWTEIRMLGAIHSSLQSFSS